MFKIHENYSHRFEFYKELLDRTSVLTNSTSSVHLHALALLCQVFKGLEQILFGWKVLIYNYNLDMSISEEM